MFRLEKQRTTSTPYILIDEAESYMVISGESFPENVSEFYKDVIQWLSNYLDRNFSKLTVDFELVYFNSSTSKLLMNVFDLLETAVSNGKFIVVNWIYNADNDIIKECGEEFAEDFDSLKINLVIK